MEKNENKNNLLLSLLGLLSVVVIVAVIGFYAAKPEPVILQGEAEANEYRVSGKSPEGLKCFFVEEGSLVHKGDTLAIIYSPELNAKLEQAVAAQAAAEAQNRKAINGARKELIISAYECGRKLRSV
jgi:HlyD family secretion protein